MKIKKIVSLVLAIVMIGACFAGCSSETSEKYSDETCIIGYTNAVAPFLEVDENGKVTGFEADLWEMIFDDVKGDYKSYVFEKVEDGYTLEEDGGFFNDGDSTEYSADLLIGAVSKNDGTFNEDYSFTEPIITDRVIAVTVNDAQVKTYADFSGKNIVSINGVANDTLQEQTTIATAGNVTVVDTLDDALAMLDSGKADVMITDEFTFSPSEKASSYTVLNGELDTIEYVIACAKYSGWKDSINEAIREKKSADYGTGDEFTPLVEKYFGYNASSFNYETDADK